MITKSKLILPVLVCLIPVLASSFASTPAFGAELRLQIEESGRISSEKVFDLSKKKPAGLIRHGQDGKIAYEMDDGTVSCGVFFSPSLQGLALLTTLNLNERRSVSTSANLEDPEITRVSAKDPTSQRSCKLVVRRS